VKQKGPGYGVRPSSHLEPIPSAADYVNALLYVNGAMEDTSYGTYTFPKLKAATLQ